MLFRTVYGPELEAIYHFIAKADIPPTRQTIHSIFLPHSVNGQTHSTQSIDDALSFLESARLTEENDGHYTVTPLADEPFRVKTLRNLRALELGDLEPAHSFDPLYNLILTELFIRPNQLFVTDVHSQANKLRQIAAVGGLSREKLQAWRRVMAFLGLGKRVAAGFMCVYSPELLLDIFSRWSQTAGTLQQFLEAYLVLILPVQTENGDLAQAIAEPLRFLETQGVITLKALQDSPSKPYFGERKIKYIVKGEAAYAH